MLTVRVLRLTQIGGVDYQAGTVLTLNEPYVDRLVRLGLVAVLDETSAPQFYKDRMMTNYNTRMTTAKK